MNTYRNDLLITATRSLDREAAAEQRQRTLLAAFVLAVFILAQWVSA